MKTQDELLEHYWSVIVPMAREHWIKPWDCVRLGNALTEHPWFCGPVEDYTFAVAILEGKPVFVGDVVFSKLNYGAVIDWNFLLPDDWDCWTWTPPTEKRTFVLELTEQELVFLGKIPVEQRLFDHPETLTLISKVRTLLDYRSKQK